MTSPLAQDAQHMHQLSYGHSSASGFYQVKDGAELDATATYRASRPDLGAHYGRTIGRCRCGVEIMQLCVEGDTAFANRRGWVPVADLEAAYAEHAQRSLDAEPASDAWSTDHELTPHLDAVAAAQYRLPYLPSWWTLTADVAADDARHGTAYAPVVLWRLRMASRLCA